MKSKLNKLLNLWENNNLITKEQNQKISEFMKNRQKENFFRMLKWFSIIGALWLVFGIIVTIINIFELDFMAKVLDFLNKIFKFIADIVVYFWIFINEHIFIPIINLLKHFFGIHYTDFIFGVACFILFFPFNYFSNKNINVDNLNLSEEQKYCLKSNFTLDIFACICLSSAFFFFNNIITPETFYNSKANIIPFWNIAGVGTFIGLAYYYSKNVYLIFGIYMLSCCVGMFSGCGYASYFLCVSKPLMQIFVAIILLLIAYITEIKIGNKENFIQEKFTSTYTWTGLLLLFLALWIASFWGFDIDFDNFNNFNVEIFFANVLFILSSIGAMFIGVKEENKIYFNYGLVFFLIETYTVICSRLFNVLPVGIASLILGGTMIATVKVLKKTYIKKH